MFKMLFNLNCSLMFFCRRRVRSQSHLSGSGQQDGKENAGYVPDGHASRINTDYEQTIIYSYPFSYINMLCLLLHSDGNTIEL